MANDDDLQSVGREMELLVTAFCSWRKAEDIPNLEQYVTTTITKVVTLLTYTNIDTVLTYN